ncbi:hypothetical protein [Streptomyces jumonjinensis]|uniref:hypothetical protein n=1 Tax=Streptomyces jumonjinensis TaxID=1945 RepID=UPI0037A94C9E
MRIPGFAVATAAAGGRGTAPAGPPRTAGTGSGGLVPQEIFCESVEGPICHAGCEGLDNFDDCYARCLDDRCRYWDLLGGSG